MVTRQHVADWLAAYELAWRTPGIGSLRELFTQDATYQLSPYDEPLADLEAIREMWESERESPHEIFTMTSDIVALEDDVAVIRVEVTYGEPARQEYRDLWVVRFAEDGRCLSFEEWPFWPGQPRSAARPA